jgi:hypothetical protein
MKKEKSVKSANKSGKAKKEHSCLCPYCEEELVIASCPFCQACGSVISYCVTCQIMVPDTNATTCPECGAPLKKGRKK